MSNKIKIWLAVKATDGDSANGFTTHGTRPHFVSLPKIPKVFDYLCDVKNNFYRVIDPTFQYGDETEITAIPVDKSDSMWKENTQMGKYIQLPF
ncbi:MAG TPA: hypothetical protein VG895_00500 [Patescibacteria group bacterium]|nr:hypothetical protein [Gammaproteobacteria bacterium]HWA51522.1 hypothetical protein [Patescibacteria group bacterium]